MTDAQTEARAIYERGINAGQQYSVVNEIATALAAKDAELDGAVFLKDAAEAALRKREVEINKLHAQLAEARKALANYDRWLNGRDAYIVQKGLWQNFVASLPGSPTARRAIEAQGGENGHA